ncbi:hypothetical protein ACERK3_09255 [Phycisphaerales bacterium AB-hyl4]|uniref:Uncharacterized protein n=1 Tax=Natronomicrosphaera hydrolytica TaxID=3242702 RepID=A0ABV4U6V5_9BACT
MYEHLLAWPYKHLHLDGLAGRVEYAQFLHDASEIQLGLDAWHGNQITADQTTLTLNLPQHEPDVSVPVIELFLKK